jgi:hypothetical protein
VSQVLQIAAHVLLPLLLAGCSEARAPAFRSGGTSEKRPSEARSPEPERALASDGTVYSVTTLAPGGFEIESEVEREELTFVVLQREADATGYGAEGELWSHAIGAEYLLHEALRPVEPEPVTIVQVDATCVARSVRLVLARPRVGDDARELLEIEGCALIHDPLAIGGSHVDARRTARFTQSSTGADARRELDRIGLVETPTAMVHPLQSLRVDRYGELWVVTPSRPLPEYGDVAFDATLVGEIAYITLHGRLIEAHVDWSGHSLIELDGRQLVVLLQAGPLDVALRVLEVSGESLIHVLESCDPTLPVYLGPRCHRPAASGP